jgi:hypothetical protein
MGQPTNITPPIAQQPVADDGTQHTLPWAEFFQALADRLNAMTSGGVVMQTGTSTSDPAGLISVTLPVPYTTRTLDFQCDGSPVEPHAYFNQGTVTALPLDVITGVLSKDAGGGSIVAVPNTDFTWFATGV